MESVKIPAQSPNCKGFASCCTSFVLFAGIWKTAALFELATPSCTNTRSNPFKPLLGSGMQILEDLGSDSGALGQGIGAERRGHFGRKTSPICGECRHGHSLSRAPLSGRRLVTTRAWLVGVVDLGEVGRSRKLGLRRGARGGAARGFAEDSEVVPSRQTCLKRKANRPSGSSCRRSFAMGGRARYRHKCSRPSRSLAPTRTLACTLKPATSAHRLPMIAASASSPVPPRRNTRQPRRGPVATSPCTDALARWSRVSCWYLSSRLQRAVKPPLRAGVGLRKSGVPNTTAGLVVIRASPRRLQRRRLYLTLLSRNTPVARGPHPESRRNTQNHRP